MGKSMSPWKNMYKSSSVCVCKCMLVRAYIYNLIEYFRYNIFSYTLLKF